MRLGKGEERLVAGSPSTPGVSVSAVTRLACAGRRSAGSSEPVFSSATAERGRAPFQLSNRPVLACYRLTTLIISVGQGAT